MGKKKKGEKKKAGKVRKEDASANHLQELMQENEMLRARLEKIAEIASSLPGVPLLHDLDEEDEEDELKRDVDDQIAEDEQAGRIEPVSGS